jgi:hypothetical protein
MEEAEDGGSPQSGGLGETVTLHSMALDDQVGPAPGWEVGRLAVLAPTDPRNLAWFASLQGKHERLGDFLETRTASTATLHRLDMSPAPSSTLTTRRSVRRQRCLHAAAAPLCAPPAARRPPDRLRKNAGGQFEVGRAALSRAVPHLIGRRGHRQGMRCSGPPGAVPAPPPADPTPRRPRLTQPPPAAARRRARTSSGCGARRPPTW